MIGRLRKPEVDRDVATAVADVLSTVAEMREASRLALEAKKRADEPGAAVKLWTRARQAAVLVEDLYGRVSSRARSAGLETNELLKLAGDVIDGKRCLPAGVEPLEIA